MHQIFQQLQTISMLLHPPSKPHNLDLPMPDSEPAVIQYAHQSLTESNLHICITIVGLQKRDSLDTSNMSAAMTIPFLLHPPSKPHNLDPSIHTHTLVLILIPSYSHYYTLTTILIPPYSYRHTHTTILIPPYHHTTIPTYHRTTMPPHPRTLISSYPLLLVPSSPHAHTHSLITYSILPIASYP